MRHPHINITPQHVHALIRRHKGIMHAINALPHPHPHPGPSSPTPTGPAFTADSTSPASHDTATSSSAAAPTPVLTRDPRLRYVRPYWHAFSTMAKGRWWNREILELISTEFRDRSVEYYRFALAAGVTTINGRRAQPGDVVRNGDRIQNVVHRHEPPVTGRVQVVSGQKELDNQLVVVMKPGSVPVHAAGRYFRNSLVEILKTDFGMDKVYTVNRLDRLTSGLMLVATTPQRASELCKQFAENRVKKEYLARVAGEFPEEEVTISEPMLTIDRQMGLVIVHPSGKPSLTIFKRLFYDRRSHTSVLHCQPRTGRTHQIRVHLQYLGFPIANDPIYRADNVWGSNGGKGGIDLRAMRGERTPSVMPEEAARVLGVERRVDGLGDGVPVVEAPPRIPGPEALASDAEPVSEPAATGEADACPGVDTPLEATPAAPARLPRETGADIGLSSPVPLSSEAIEIIKCLRDQKDKDEDWARWRDVVFRAADAGRFLRGEGRAESASGPAVARIGHYALRDPAGEEGKEGGEGEAEVEKKEEEEEFHPMLDPATNTLYCPICYAPLHPDPKPEKMYIFLHAWRYTTEEGCWESERPEWALEGWSSEGAERAGCIFYAASVSIIRQAGLTGRDGLPRAYSITAAAVLSLCSSSIRSDRESFCCPKLCFSSSAETEESPTRFMNGGRAYTGTKDKLSTCAGPNTSHARVRTGWKLVCRRWRISGSGRPSRTPIQRKNHAVTKGAKTAVSSDRRVTVAVVVPLLYTPCWVMMFPNAIIVADVSICVRRVLTRSWRMYAPNSEAILSIVYQSERQ
ncbi:pseudouridine synthase [Calocera cornea HHB12733]|uniref:Pseudouridine synthase n=1 Tax=Calocera cornea HHB12733 TaxID=1353952 RepID=A0A165EX99_9BASI|nr:pseudouridine synthase [Calocera cornea HHB12733]